MLLADKADYIDRARYLATQAREPVAHYEHKAIGYNYRMSNVLAGLGNSQLADLDRRIAARRAHYEAYRAALGDLPGIEFMPIAEPNAANYWLTCLTIDPNASGSSRNTLIAALEAADIEARPLWKPLHLQPVFKDKKYFGGNVAAKLFDYGLCLPSGSGMRNSERQLVIDTIKAELPKGKSS
jgi:pyridoxal phosphate-dependent aminotransferase EpsN